MEEEAHVIINERELSSKGNVVLEFDVNGALVLDEAPKVSEEEVLRKAKTTDFSMVWLICCLITIDSIMTQSDDGQ